MNHRLSMASVLMTLLLAGGIEADPAHAASKQTWLTGVNLSGAEYNAASTRMNFDYTYPTKAELDYYVKKGFKVLRVPVLGSRILPANLQDKGGGKDWIALNGFIAQAGSAGASVVIDLHQYGAMPSGLVGKDQAATSEFVAAWGEIAKRLKSTHNVIFGLMNEPNAQSAADWLSGANAAIAQIRREGATQLILVPGSYWTGAHNWTSTDNSAVMAGVVDPGKNFAYEVHQYVDQNSSGTTPDVAHGTGSTSLAAFTSWARAHHAKAFLGEFGFASSDAALKEGADLVAYMAANKDVWCGWTYWAGGPWWGNYMFSVEPSNGVDKPQMRVLTTYQ